MRSPTLRKALRYWTTVGPSATLKVGAKTLLQFAHAFVSVPRSQFSDLEALVDFTFTTSGGFIRPTQDRSELMQLARLVSDLKPRTVLEIGTAKGGTFFLFTRLAAPDAHLISVDLPGGQFGDGYPIWRAPLYRSFAQRGQHIDLLRADSHSYETRIKLEALLKGKKIDFLFIDADHTYEGVKTDFEMYRPLVRPGGLIGFHDITEYNDKLTAPGWAERVSFGVNRFWDETKTSFRHFEFIRDPTRNYGIGVIVAD